MYRGIYTHPNTIVKQLSRSLSKCIQLISPGKQSYFRTKMAQRDFRNPTYTGGKSWDDFPSCGNKITGITHRHIEKSILR